jgi:hypothetical protein
VPSAAHARAASFIQTKLSNAIVAQLLLPNNVIPEDEIITTINDECNKHLLIRPNSIVITLPSFCGEPDGGLLWDGEDYPFALLEVGYSDCGRKTRGRSSHWLTRGAGRVCPSFSSSLLMIQIKLSLSIKIEAANYALQSIEVDSYKWSNQPVDDLATRNSIHGRALHMEKLVSFLFALLS